MADDVNPVGDGQSHEARPAATHWSRRQEVTVYLLAAVAYMLLGFVAKGVFAWWLFGAIFLLVVVWGVPAIWRRLA